MLNEGVEVPAIAPLFAGGQRDVDFSDLDGKVLLEGFCTDCVFDEKRSEVFNLVAAANGVGKIEALVKVDDPIGILAHTFAGSGARFSQVRDALTGVVRGVGGTVHGSEAEGAIAGFDSEACAVFYGHPRRDAGDDAGGVVALAVIADHAPEKLMNREVLHFSLDRKSTRLNSSHRCISYAVF